MSLDELVDLIIDVVLILSLFLVLSGCSSVQRSVEKPPEFHPAWPMPTLVCAVDWKIVLDNGWPVVGIPYPQNLDLKACNKDKARYIKEVTNLLCYYRPKDDPHCV